MATGDLKVSYSTNRLGALLTRHGLVIDRRVRRAIGVTGLTPRHGMTLLNLAEHGPMSQQALIEALGVDPSVLVCLLNDLERDGLAGRERDPADRRRHIVTITDGGVAALQRVERALDAVERELFADLDEAERTQLHALLSKIRITGDDTDDAC